MDFTKLKTQKIEQVVANLKEQEKKSYGDDRFWKLTVDEKTGNGFAVIRFLPGLRDDALPYAMYYSHFFKGPTGKYYVEKSRTTIGELDPITEANKILWAKGEEGQKKVRDGRKRKAVFVANILVVKDPAHPENNGKVFLFEYGKMIDAKLKYAIDPQLGEDPISPFNPFDLGANLRLVATTVAGQRKYDASTWEPRKAVADTDEEIVAICEKQYDVYEFIDPSTFKSYEELERRYNDVMGISQPPPQKVANSDAPRPVEKPEEDSEDNDVPWVPSDDDDDFLASLAKDLESQLEG